ncbi:ULP_PROTEASE domain-containing protein [Raphanus sativus]|nr:ULP_PROTEASE domain-containing protein [Raphanus sativus]
MRRSARQGDKGGTVGDDAEPPTVFRRRSGKEPAVEETNPTDGPDERLPLRLFETDRFPSRRLNIYSSLGYLLMVRDALKGTPDLARLLHSCFGPLFNIPVRRCSYSSVMLHAMLVRQVVTKKRYELWPVVGGNPLKFSLVEFGRVTGLPCGEFEDGYSVDVVPKAKEDDFAFWDYLFEGRRDITIAEVARMIEEDLTIPRSRKFRLCMILIVDGVLLASTSPVCPTLKHVKRLENLSKFLEFPWGRESFYWTISTMIPPRRVLGVCDDPQGDLCASLRQQTKKMSGFPLALQLLVYEAIPLLSARLGGTDELKLIDCESLPQRKGLKLWDLLEVENHPELNVEPMMEEPEGAPEGWGVWDDEIADRTVIYMAGRLASGHKFRKTAWRGGDAEEVLYNHDKAKEERKRKRKREAGGPKSGAVAGPLLKQRRLGAYFKKHALADTGNNAELLARIQALEKTVSWLKRKVNKRRKLGVTPRRELMRSGKPLKRIRKEMPTGSREDEECEEDEGDKGGRNGK